MFGTKTRLTPALFLSCAVALGACSDDGESVTLNGHEDASTAVNGAESFLGTWAFLIGNVDYQCPSGNPSRQPDATNIEFTRQPDGSFTYTENSSDCTVQFDYTEGSLVAREGQSCSMTAGSVTVTDSFTTNQFGADVTPEQIRATRTGTLTYSTGASCTYNYNAVAYGRQ